MKELFFKYAVILVLLAGYLTGCEKLEDTYSKHTGDGPEQYLTKIYDLKGEPKWLSVLLTWNLKLDPGRTAIMVEWTDDEKTDSVIIDRDSESYLVEGLKNYEYTFRVSAIEQKEGEIIKQSLGDPVYVRPYTSASEELLLFTRVVNKQFQVADKYLFVAFDEWADNLIAFKIGYFEKGSETEQFWEVGPEDRENSWPKGKSYALIGENIDFTKPVKVYRKGKIAILDDMILDLDPIELSFNVPSFESDFAADVRNRLDLLGEIKQDDIKNVEILDIDYDQISLIDVLHFPNLKELHLGRNRYLALGTEDRVRSSLSNKELSIGALNVIAEKLGVKIYHYGNHYFDVVPDFFTEKNKLSEQPMLAFMDATNWDISVSPADALGYDSGAKNLLVDNDSYWLPQPTTQIRTHVIEIDMKQEETIAGFKIVQTKDFGDPDASRPETLSIEVETGSGQWATATFSKSTTLGNGEGETTIVYLNKDKGTKTVQKIRITVSDDFYKQGYDSSWNWVDFYNVTLSSIMVIKGN